MSLAWYGAERRASDRIKLTPGDTISRLLGFSHSAQLINGQAQGQSRPQAFSPTFDIDEFSVKRSEEDKKSFQHFADTLALALLADACTIHQCVEPEIESSDAEFSLLASCSFLQRASTPVPTLLPDSPNDMVKSISIHNAVLAQLCVQSLAGKNQDALQPFAHVLTLRFAPVGGRLWIVQLFRKNTEQPFVGSDEQRILSLLPLLIEHACLLLEEAQHESVQAAVRQITDALAFGFFCVNDRCHIVSSNKAGETILEEGDPLSLSQGHLSIKRRRENALLHASVAQACAEETISKDSYTIIEAVHGPHAHPYLIHVFPAGGLLGRRLAMVLVFDPDVGLRTTLEPVCEALGLSASEARLAITLADGLSLKEAADTIGIKEHTARTYLKQIFAKVRVQRQADLVRVLLRSAIPFRADQ